MKLRNLFLVGVALLLGTLVTQIGVALSRKPEANLIAMWRNRPSNISQGLKLANLVVTGRVTKIERAQDLVCRSPDPANEVLIPIEVVTFVVEKYHKGAPRDPDDAQQTIQIFHTGSSSRIPVEEREEPPISERPLRPLDGVERPAQLPKLTEEDRRTVILHDDPAYKVGERYVLLLTDGPIVTVHGSSVSTRSVISPEGRYKVTEDNKIEPATMLGFAGKQKGKALALFETQMLPSEGNPQKHESSRE